MSDTIIIIPSRMSAQRLTGKPLFKINGKTIISQVFNKTRECKIGNVTVTTEDKENEDEIKKNKGKQKQQTKKQK